MHSPLSRTRSSRRPSRSSLDARESALARRFRLVTVEVEAGPHRIELVRPESSEALISEADFDRDERLPYWAELWPSALVLAQDVALLDGGGRSMLELGCGVGLVAAAGVQAGFDVTASDYYDDALLFAGLNVARNTGREPTLRTLDWRSLPDDIGRFDVVVASDVLYEKEYPPLIAAALGRALAADGMALVADPGRVAAPGLPDACTAHGLAVTSHRRIPFEEGAIRQTIDLLTIQRTRAPVRNGSIG